VNLVVAKKKEKVIVLLDEDENARFDACCARRGVRKPALITRLIRHDLECERFQAQRRLPLGDTRRSEP